MNVKIVYKYYGQSAKEIVFPIKKSYQLNKVYDFLRGFRAGRIMSADLFNSSERSVNNKQEAFIFISYDGVEYLPLGEHPFSGENIKYAFQIYEASKKDLAVELCSNISMIRQLATLRFKSL